MSLKHVEHCWTISCPKRESFQASRKESFECRTHQIQVGLPPDNLHRDTGYHVSKRLGPTWGPHWPCKLSWWDHPWGLCAEYRACFGLWQAVKSKWHRASDQGDHARIQKFKAIKRTGSSEGCVMTTATATVLCDLQVGSDQNPCAPSSWPVAASWNSEEWFIEPRRAPISWVLECPWPRAPFQRVGFANNHSNSKQPLPSTGWNTIPGWSCWLRCSWGHLKGQLKMVQHVQLQRL